MTTPSTEAVRAQEHANNTRIHYFIAGIVGVIGFALIMFGPMMAFGVVAICIATLYGAAVAIFGRVQRGVDTHTAAPRAEELNSASAYNQAKHG